MPWSNTIQPKRLATADTGNRVIIDGSNGAGKIDFYTGVAGETPAEIAAQGNSGGPTLGLTAGNAPGQNASIASVNITNTVATLYSGVYPTANQVQVTPTEVHVNCNTKLKHLPNDGTPSSTYLTTTDRWTGTPVIQPNTTNGSAVVNHGLGTIPSAISCQLVQPASGAATGGTNPITVLLLNLSTWTTTSFNVQLFTISGAYTAGALQRLSVICHA